MDEDALKMYRTENFCPNFGKNGEDDMWEVMTWSEE